MATFKYLERDIYYEVYGEGKPIILLNGIMMSTYSWINFKESLSENNKLILVDFLDQGQSGKLEEDYTQEVQVDLIKALLDEINLDTINIVGTSYGGEVAIQFALKYPDKVDRLVLFNTVARTSSWLKDIGKSWNRSADDPLNYYLTTIPIIYSPEFYNKNLSWMNERKEILVNNVFNNKGFMDSMKRLTNSAEDYNVVDRLREIETETLIVSSDTDHVTPINEQRILNKGIKNSEMVILNDTGHASMYERPLLFCSLILGFVNVKDTEYNIL